MKEIEIDEREIEHAWDLVSDSAVKAVEAYDAFVTACDALAGHLDYNPDWILARCLPRVVAERRSNDRILRILDADREEWTAHLRDSLLAKRRQQLRQELIAKLNLTEDQKKLLGLK